MKKCMTVLSRNWKEWAIGNRQQWANVQCADVQKENKQLAIEKNEQMAPYSIGK